MLGRRLLGWLSRGRGDFLFACRVASPDESSPIIISYRVHVEEFFFEDIEVFVIQIEAHLQCSIRYPSLAFEEVDDLGKNFIEGHGRCSTALTTAVSSP